MKIIASYLFIEKHEKLKAKDEKLTLTPYWWLPN
jgi:hypothetical protein